MVSNGSTEPHQCVGMCIQAGPKSENPPSHQRTQRSRHRSYSPDSAKECWISWSPSRHGTIAPTLADAMTTASLFCTGAKGLYIRDRLDTTVVCKSVKYSDKCFSGKQNYN